MTARVPNWLKAEKGKPIRIIPERARFVKQMFRWAATGLGQYAICDKLIEAGVEPWGKTYKGMPARWTPFYISEILSSRSTIGEYQPSHEARNRWSKEASARRRSRQLLSSRGSSCAFPKGAGCAANIRANQIWRVFSWWERPSLRQKPISETGMGCNRWIACFAGLPLCNDLTLSGHYPQEACPVAQ